MTTPNDTSEIDDMMANAFGSATDDEHLTDDEPVEAPAEEAEGEEVEASAEEAEEATSELEEELLDDETDDEPAEEDGSEVGDDDGESAPDGDPVAGGDGADDAMSDGQIALNMMVDQKASTYQIPEEVFDPAIVGLESAYVADAKESLGEDTDEDFARKMGKLAHKTAVRTARERFDATKEQRVRLRRDAATASIRRQVNEIATRSPDELSRVENRMARIYQEKVDKYGVDAANDIPVEAYFRLAGGKLSAPKQKAAGRAGVATKKAKAQKRGAVRGTKKPDQIGRVRKAKQAKRSKDQDAFDDLNRHLGTHKAIEDFFFG